MSSVNDILGAIGIRPGTGTAQQPAPFAPATPAPGGANAAQQLRDRFEAFKTTFSHDMADVFERGATGEFDDPTLRLQEQAALQRLHRATLAASGAADGAATPSRSEGAAAAPDAAGSGAITGARQPDAAAAAAVAEQRQLYSLRVAQSEARLRNISATLQRDFPKAAQLVSASTGTWDPATFSPRTVEEVEAFAQRMVIDATEAAARLEIVKTQLDAARFELAQGGDARAQAAIAKLEADYARQKAYVDKLATIVDEHSGGQVTDAGVDALAGATLRDAGDIPVGELAAAMRAEGMDEAKIRRLVGATELAVEQEKTPGGSPRLKRIANDMTATLLARFNRMREQRRDEFAQQERARVEEERMVQRRVDEQRTHERALDQAEQRQGQLEQALDQRAAQRSAEFEQWMATLDAARAQERQAAG